MTTELFIILSVMWVFGLIAAYMIGCNHGLTKGFKLNTISVDKHREAFDAGFEYGKSSMAGWKTESEQQKKKIEQLNRFIVRELKTKNGR